MSLYFANFINGRDRTRKRLEEIEESGLAFSIISLAEVYEGIYYSKDPEGNEKALLDFLQDVTLINIDEEISRLFGKERGRLRALPRLDRLLPHREVAKAVLGAILSKGPRKEKALENLARAAKRLESWTSDDTEAVLRSNLQPRAKAVLLS